jgi:hypothetical protein
MGKEGSEVLDAICSLQVLYVGINWTSFIKIIILILLILTIALL